jgi:DNA-binding NarL/FixJ family response regulator
LKTRKIINPSINIIDSAFSCPVGITRESTIKVLHVDDDACILRISKRILELTGAYEVETASSVGEAFDKMGKDKYDVVVSDYHMPGKDGLQFLKELREKGNRISFVLFSGEGRDEIRIDALSFGADGYFSKIGSPETVYRELSSGIESAIERTRIEIKV